MATVLQIGDRTIKSEEIIPLMAGYKILPQLLSETIIDQAIANIDCTPEETESACEEFYQHWHLTNNTQKQAWLQRYGMRQQQLDSLATRNLRIEKFKQKTWGHKLESYFLKRKEQLDQAIYSLLRVKDQGLANELYFRIKEGEQSFSELAFKHSEGAEAKTGGLIGPVELRTLHPNLAQILRMSQPGEIWTPLPFGEWQVVVRLEKLIPAQLDEGMRQRLLQEKFQAWFQEQLGQLSPQDQMWMGVTPNQQAA
ncbi:MAG: peptidylprolyl isomerase [Spirirestis rafaelensis WJT71-NPBG6]|jgi:parvulin-like peptidyl-prolyl isomerase|nr:peptidylprolyl isomerase [Spirirestis rafaelensis WJT71-NPBG6]